MKKIIFLTGVLAVGLLLTGCTKKTATTTRSPTTDSADVGTKTSGSATATATGNYPQIDVATIDAAYQKNYQQALTSVNTYLQNQAQFCSAIIEFQQLSLANANQFFFFNTANSQIKDWYGVIEIDPVAKTTKRQLAAKKDYSSDVQCQTASTATPPSYAAAYQQFMQAYPELAGATVGKTKMSLQDSVWDITTWAADGTVAATKQISTTATSSTSTSASSTATATGQN